MGETITCMGQVRAAVRAIASSASRRVRPTDRVIMDLPDWAGFGNQLFFFLWASTQQSRGAHFRLVRSSRSMPWLERFPLMAAELTIDRRETRLVDRRDTTPWADITAMGQPNMPSRDDVTHFIETYLMPSGLFGRSEELARGLTLNVRRGDYFSAPDVRGIFSFDQIAYIDAVLDTIDAHGRRPEQIRVVSDDLSWCRARLQHLGTAGTTVHFTDSSDPLEDLRTVACSRELVIMNSSFSIWAAYISNHVYGDNYGLIHAPAFGTRPFDGTPWPSLDPRWDIVADIPGGWDS